MMKLFCDLCGKELDSNNMNYVGLSINDYADDSSEIEHFDFCHECAAIIKHCIFNNMTANHEQKVSP